MNSIRKNTKGLIVAGKWKGQAILIEDTVKETGGYLILIGPDARGEQGGDLWIESVQLEKAFEQAGWEVEWSHDKPA